MTKQPELSQHFLTKPFRTKSGPCAKSSTFGIYLLIRTALAEHNMWLSAYAVARGQRLKYYQDLINQDTVMQEEPNKAYRSIRLTLPDATHREIVNNKPEWM